MPPHCAAQDFVGQPWGLPRPSWGSFRSSAQLRESPGEAPRGEREGEEEKEKRSSIQRSKTGGGARARKPQQAGQYWMQLLRRTCSLPRTITACKPSIQTSRKLVRALVGKAASVWSSSPRRPPTRTPAAFRLRANKFRYAVP
ncbi:unnamed protein product [Prorocentrum cordatum]|uniref:Uncharacterized protein n=1 Tax=Prorocentrum cordatum TaxID=2364126 RepID=A0ABN9SCP6_9DINO|nr:unnamed protein product [Polarella glacialis]